MKNIIKSITAVTILSIVLFSCKKTEELVPKTIDQTINAGQEYSIPLPLTDDPYAILIDAKNASSSSISKDANGNPIYVYSSNAEFVGTEKIVVVTTEGVKGKGMHPHPHGHGAPGMAYVDPQPHPHGMCNKSKTEGAAETEDDFIVTINLTVNAIPAVVVAAAESKK